MNEREIAEQMVKDGKAMIADAEKRLTGLEVTYSIGDRFRYSCRGRTRKFILTGHNNGSTFIMSELSNGVEYNSPVKVKDNTKITQREINSTICGFDSFVRYWNNNQ